MGKNKFSSVSVSISYCVLIRFSLETDTEIDREFLSNFQDISLENKLPDWKGLIGEGLTRGFTQFDMNYLSVSVSILDCILIRFLFETDTEIDREFLSNIQNISLGNKFPEW